MRALLSSLLVVVAVAPVTAAPRALVEAFGAACHTRAYDRAHLARHPRQIVTSMTLRDGALRRAELSGFDAVVDIRLTLRGGETVEASGYCTKIAAGIACALEGDAGAIKITRRQTGGVLVAIDGRFDIETSRGVQQLAESDDRLFALYPSGSCD